MWSMEAISFGLTAQLSSLSTVKFQVKFWHSEVQCLHLFSRILIAENWFIKLKICTDNNLLFFKEGGKMFNCFKSELREDSQNPAKVQRQVFSLRNHDDILSDF